MLSQDQEAILCTDHLAWLHLVVATAPLSSTNCSENAHYQSNGKIASLILVSYEQNFQGHIVCIIVLWSAVFLKRKNKSSFEYVSNVILVLYFQWKKN